MLTVYATCDALKTKIRPVVLFGSFEIVKHLLRARTRCNTSRETSGPEYGEPEERIESVRQSCAMGSKTDGNKLLIFIGRFKITITANYVLDWRAKTCTRDTIYVQKQHERRRRWWAQVWRTRVARNVTETRLRRIHADTPVFVTAVAVGSTREERKKRIRSRARARPPARSSYK